MEKLLEMVNGGKTIIGLVSIIVGMSSISQYISSEEVTEVLNAILIAAGAISTAVGFSHKLYKKLKLETK